jgi:catechol 2,3-dioxygenase-like lactoylglutathione lyase family enzyme
MLVIGLDHVQLSLPPGGELNADHFYVDLLGFDVEEKPPALAARGGRWYRSGGVRFHLGVDSDFQPATRSHPAFVVRQLDELVRRLEAEGINPDWDESIPGVRRCYVSDPFGNRVELVASD